MYQDQSISFSAACRSVLDESGMGLADFSRLRGTVISDVNLGDDGILELKGRDRDGAERWRLRIGGSARFTFSPALPQRSWQVEANFDAGGSLRSSDRTMISAVCGAVIEGFRAEEDGLLIHSDDGRAIEVPYALNEDGIAISILPEDDQPRPCLIVLPGEC